jgi:hypothetical protein
LVDEQDLPDGGRCGVFEGGHIHRYGNIAKPFPADQCAAKYKAVPRCTVWNGMVGCSDLYPPFFTLTIELIIMRSLRTFNANGHSCQQLCIHMSVKQSSNVS